VSKVLKRFEILAQAKTRDHGAALESPLFPAKAQVFKGKSLDEQIFQSLTYV